MITTEQLEQYHQDGYLIVRGLFDEEEAHILRETARSDRAMEQHTHGLSDGEGGTQKLALWNKAGDDAYGLVARSRRLVDRMEILLGGEVHHFHSKMSIKEPFTGGAWAWHQDYGYWYDQGFLFPHLASCFIAIDPCTRENGCMQVLKGSHEMGRIEHGRYGDQTGADPKRTDAAMKELELVYVLMEPGDALFFHSNTLHRSDQNTSPTPRWSLICCYNAARNPRYEVVAGIHCEPIEKVDDAELKNAGIRTDAAGTYWSPQQNEQVEALTQ